jgi:16S rRNA (cytidine1402-2'-O)-methyltransferase
VEPKDCSPGKLFIIATPIGNLNDFSHRAENALNNCDLVACEDTRVTAKLLSHYSIKKSLVSYRDENEKKQAKILTSEIMHGKNIALVSDAGFPTISDPGFRLVRECHLKSIQVVPVPGPNAALTALSASGLPTHQFLFLGFLPKKKLGVSKLLEQWREFEGSLIVYESRYKIERTLALILSTYGPGRFICIARELTKLHESIISGPASQVIEKFHQGSAKGEFTLVIGPANYSFNYKDE